MSHHNFTNVAYKTSDKRRIGGLASNNPTTMLKNLEMLGLIAHSDDFHKFVSEGTAKISALGEKRRFYEYEVDKAFEGFDAPIAEKLAFKINLERAGIMQKNPV